MKKLYFLAVVAIIGAAFVNPSKGQVTITFRVDMQEQIISPNGIHITGNFQGWDPSSTSMSSFIGDVYTYEYTGSPGEYLEYKFVNGNAWGDDEQITAICNAPGTTNRFLYIPDNDSLLPSVCFGECLPCVLPEVNVTFKVDMANEVVAGGVFIAGDFNGWNTTANPMTNTVDDVYEMTLLLEVGNTYQYKFLNGGNYETVPPECGYGGYNNRQITVPANPFVEPLVCYSSCDPCTSVTDINVTFQVDMSEADSISSAGIHIAGGFQGWIPSTTEMTDMGGGIYTYSTILQSGSYHEYKFVNDTTWAGVENVPWFCNSNGNRFLIVPGNDTILPAVCFANCLVCNPDPVEITFQVDMSLQFVSPDGVHIAGSFQGWDPVATPMTHIGGKIYEVTLSVGEGEFHEYKFINGNDFLYAENVALACANFSGNREFFVSSSSTNMDLVCFGECEPCQGSLYTFNLKVLLEGAYNGVNMNTKLFDSGVLPTEQPFNVEPWNYDGLETITAPSDAEIVDWVYIQLRETSGDASTAISDSLIDHQAAVLLADGTIARPDGNPNFYYTGDITENLYIVIFQRNHLSVMSATPLVEIFSMFAYDFTTDLSKAYLGGHKLLGGGMYGMIGGDSDANGSVGTKDKNINWTNEAGSAGYFSSDLNLDTQINNPDKNDVWEPNLNSGSQVPQ